MSNTFVAVLCIILMTVTSMGILRLIGGRFRMKDIQGVCIITGVIFAICSGVVGGAYAITYGNAVMDTEVLNGQVTGKAKTRVSCSHSYDCNCTTSKDANGNTSTKCQTCYEHSYDIDWDVYVSVPNENFTVNRINKQGTETPPRWTKMQVGDPFATTQTFRNYLKISAQNLYKTEGIDPALLSKVPAYPLHVYDYLYLNRALTTEGGIPLEEWNKSIWNGLRELGPAKQVNLVVVLTKQAPQFTEALKASWLGGKKNDVIVVLGVPEYPKLSWARVVSWTPNELFKVQLRDRLSELSEVNAKVVTDIAFSEISKGYQRLHMRDLEYLTKEIQLSIWWYFVFGFLAVAIPFGIIKLK